MEYTIGQVAEMAGISTRTLRYYDAIGLLRPAKTTDSGYRIYGTEEIDQLQQILFYKELGVELDDIKSILSSPNFDRAAALRAHREKLMAQRRRLDLLIANVEKSLDAMERNAIMMDHEKFEGFKEALIEENEQKFGTEVRQKYGDEAVDRSNAKLRGMTQAQYEEAERIEAEMRQTLAEAMKTGDPGGELAQKAADLHRQWLSYYWADYSKEAHAGLAQLYVDDERFTSYYDKEQPGTARFLRDAVQIYTGMAPN